MSVAKLAKVFAKNCFFFILFKLKFTADWLPTALTELNNSYNEVTFILRHKVQKLATSNRPKLF